MVSAMSNEAAAEALRRLRGRDGGYAPAPGGQSEPEPTALAALALQDPDATQWLIDHQQDDGGFITGPPALHNDSATSIAILPLTGAPRERAIDFLASHPAPAIPFDARFPHDPATRGWGWTSRTFGWVEPTARAVLALKLSRPAASAEIDDGLAVLRDRECEAGGWNYGSREVLDRMLEPFLQTTAVGLMAVQNGPEDLRDRAAERVLELWATERGGLGWSMGLVALRLVGLAADEHADALEEFVAENRLLDDAVALGWAVLALGDGWRAVEVPP